MHLQIYIHTLRNTKTYKMQGNNKHTYLRSHPYVQYNMHHSIHAQTHPCLWYTSQHTLTPPHKCIHTPHCTSYQNMPYFTRYIHTYHSIQACGQTHTKKSKHTPQHTHMPRLRSHPNATPTMAIPDMKNKNKNVET